MKLETWGFKFLFLLFGESFKGKELDTPGFQFSPTLKGFEPPIYEGYQIRNP